MGCEAAQRLIGSFSVKHKINQLCDGSAPSARKSTGARNAETQGRNRFPQPAGAETETRPVNQTSLHGPTHSPQKSAFKKGEPIISRSGPPSCSVAASHLKFKSRASDRSAFKGGF